MLHSWVVQVMAVLTERGGGGPRAHVALPSAHCTPYRWPGACRVTVCGPIIAFFNTGSLRNSFYQYWPGAQKSSCCWMEAYSLHHLTEISALQWRTWGEGELWGYSPQNQNLKTKTYFVDSDIRHCTLFTPSAEISLWNQLMTGTLEFWKVNLKNFGSLTLTENKPRRLIIPCYLN